MFRHAVLVLCLVAVAGSSRDTVTRTSRFTTEDGVFELRLKMREATTGYYWGRSTRCDYSVYRNGEFLHPAQLEGGTTIGDGDVPPGRVRVETISDGTDTVGWMIGVGGICGNTFSWKWTLVRPTKDWMGCGYEVCSFLAKDEPIVRRRDGVLEVWTQYQEWGLTGTAGSFFVPELRTVPLRMDERHGIRKVSLPADTDDWAELEYPSPLGSFVAGASQLNPDLMEAVVAECTADYMEHFAMHELPTTREGLLAMAQDVRRTKALRQRLSQFELHWVSAGD